MIKNVVPLPIAAAKSKRDKQTIHVRIPIKSPFTLLSHERFQSREWRSKCKSRETITRPSTSTSSINGESTWGRAGSATREDHQECCKHLTSYHRSRWRIGQMQWSSSRDEPMYPSLSYLEPILLDWWSRNTWNHLRMSILPLSSYSTTRITSSTISKPSTRCQSQYNFNSTHINEKSRRPINYVVIFPLYGTERDN